MEEKCILDPARDCAGSKRADEVAGDVRALSQRFSEFQQAVSETNGRFGSRIGKLEAREEVRDEQYKHLREKMDDIAKEVAEAQREQKGSIAELRQEHKASMEDLKRGNKEILDLVTPLRQKADNVEKLEKDVEELKGKPARTWEGIKSQAIGWGVALLLAILAAALGLSRFA